MAVYMFPCWALRWGCEYWRQGPFQGGGCREVSSGPGEVCRHDSISFTNIKQMFNKVCYHRYLPGWHNGKEHAYQCRRHKRRVFDPWVGKIPWTKIPWQPTPVFLPGDSHGQRSLVGYSPWFCKRAGHDWSHFIHMHTCFHNPFFFFPNTYNTWL